MNSVNRQLLFSVTEKDCRFDYFTGSGSGGQKKNKTHSGCRCTHVASKAVGKCEEGRSQRKNKEKAFTKMANSKEFKLWHKLEAARRTGDLADIEASIERSMKKIKVEGKVDGKWTELPEELS